MGAVFSPFSLLIDLDEESWEIDPQVLWTPWRKDPYRSRMIFHESIHFWQHISQGFLLRLAKEQWDRLIAYELRGEKSGPGATELEFERIDPDLGFSAKDLHECLARFWDVIVFGPKNLLDKEWRKGRSAVLPDFQENYRRKRREMGLPDGASGALDLFTAMITVAGQYAAPFNLILDSLGGVFSATCLFPLLGHFAFQTSRPAYFFWRFVESAGQKLSDLTLKTAERLNALPEDLLEDTINTLYLKTLLHCDEIVREQNGEDIEGLLTGLKAYKFYGLEQHPAYHWMYERRLLPMVDRMAISSEAVGAADYYFGKWESGRFFTAQLILDCALATGGLTDSRRILLIGGLLSPPCIRFGDGKIVSLSEIYRLESVRSLPNLQKVLLLSELIPLLQRERLEEEEQEIVRMCIGLESRWSDFISSLISPWQFT